MALPRSTAAFRDNLVRLLAWSGAVWVATILQGSLVAPLALPWRPNLPLLVAVCGAWRLGSSGGAWIGFWAGILTAAVTGMFVGSFTFSYLIAGWCVGRAREAIYADWPALILPVAGLGTLLGETIFFLWNPRHAGALSALLSQVGVNTLLSLLVYYPLVWVDARMSGALNH